MFKRLIRRGLERIGLGGRLLLRREYGVSGPHGRPDAPWACGVLKSDQEIEASVTQVQRLGLPVMAERSKNWDSLAALDLILRHTDTSARIFDAGGEWYSMIMPWLGLYGYKHLIAGNLVFDKTRRWGTIVYEYADITQTRFAAGAFDAVTCLSVIEHGVDLDAYFKEMSRILRAGGILITSTDYFETPVDTRGQTAYGVPIHIFSEAEIRQALDLATQYGFSLIAPIDLRAGDRVVHWKQYDLHYTFAIFSLKKNA